MEKMIVLVLEGVLELVRDLANGDRELVALEDLLHSIDEKLEDYEAVESEVLEILQSVTTG